LGQYNTSVIFYTWWWRASFTSRYYIFGNNENSRYRQRKHTSDLFKEKIQDLRIIVSWKKMFYRVQNNKFNKDWTLGSVKYLKTHNPADMVITVLNKLVSFKDYTDSTREVVFIWAWSLLLILNLNRTELNLFVLIRTH